VSLAQGKNLLEELTLFHESLKSYQAYRIDYLDEQLNKSKQASMYELRDELVHKFGKFKSIIIELSGRQYLTKVRGGQEQKLDMWLWGLDLFFDSESHIKALNDCIDATNQAIGKLESDIEEGIRDKQGNVTGKPSSIDTEPPKAFIAHEGETRTLTILKEFLEALGIQYFIAESKASDGRSIEKQVDWTQSEADFAVCLATKGKAINKKTGKHYMAPNIIDELGRARQVFGNKIILLVQKGVEVHTNVGEIVHETFTTTNMERAFIKITKELRNWGFIRVGKPKE